ncbi:MAG TPA: metallophosphoesterase family protein [Puia sp.]|nr:metallophosphoesterase family protein [Puia sp.]
MMDIKNRRRFLKQLAGTGAASAAANFLPGAARGESGTVTGERLPAHPEKGHVFLTPPYLQDPTANGMVIRWITDLPSYSWVEWGETSALGQKAHSVTNGLVDAYNRVNRIALGGLRPGTTYYYRVCSKVIKEFKPYQLTYGETIQSKVFSFRTVDEHPDSVSWLILNDIHDRPQSIPHLLNMRGPEPYDFVFFNGDVFDFQESEQQIIDHMLVPCTEVFASSIPFLYVRGNHETRGCFRSQLHGYFSNPEEREYFSFVRGPVHFTVLDTGEDKPDDTPVYAGIVDFDAYRREQAVWAEGVMRSEAFKRAAFRVVLMHIPIYHAGEWYGTQHCREQFGPLFNKYGVDIAISGHTHQYGVYPPVAGQHNYPIIIGGGPADGKRTLLKIKADHRQLQLTMLDDSQKQVGEYLLTNKA